MSKFSESRRGRRAPGEDHAFRSDYVCFYTNGRLASGVRVSSIEREFVRIRWAKRTRKSIVSRFLRSSKCPF